MLAKVMTKYWPILLLLACCQVASSYAEDESFNNDKLTKMQSNTDLQDKYYRQALFYYFQDQPTQALTQMEQNKARLNNLDSRSALFEAGLQLSTGLLQQAKTTLVDFDKRLSLEASQKIKAQNTDKAEKKSQKAKELRLVALLSLSNQYLLKGDNTQAKDTLSKISWLSPVYYQEYHLLNQLAYWPQKNTEMLPNPDENYVVVSPYIQLNEALRLIELAQANDNDFSGAIDALNTIKITQWQAQEYNFWQTLFVDDDLHFSSQSQQYFAHLQGQAVQDYAQLLLAQIYISQEQYQQAFNELKSFPEQSPYAESALFLFAFASQQVKQFTMSFNLLNLHYKNYPYSSLGWQSAELMAEQVSEQRSLSQGVTAYQKVEDFFLGRKQSLTDFALAFNNMSNVLDFSSDDATGLNNTHENIGSLVYSPKSVWLQQALLDAELSSLYNNLISIEEQILSVHQLQEKTVWIEQVISLNQKRKQNIIAQQATREKQGLFSRISAERDRLADLLSKSLSTQHSVNQNQGAFANADETAWLTRLSRSQQALDYIGDKKDTSEYKARLARVNGVLSWQLSQQYPERAWQHTKKLQQLDKAIADVKLQKQRITHVYQSHHSLEVSINKQVNSVKKAEALLAQLSALRENVTLNIKRKVNNYIAEQQQTLDGHLLTTRQSMAKVLERMAQEDKKRSSKLVPTASLTIEQNLPETFLTAQGLTKHATLLKKETSYLTMTQNKRYSQSMYAAAMNTAEVYEVSK